MKGGVVMAACYYLLPISLTFCPGQQHSAQERETERQGREGGLKYDSHYGGYNLVAFFTDFMTAASYSRPIGARHRLQEELGEERVTGVEKICSFQSA